MKIPIFVIIILVYLVANFYIFHRIWMAIPPNTIFRVVLVVLGLITTFGWLAAAIIGESLPISVTSVLYTIGSSWMFIVIYFVIAFLFQDLILLANKAFNFIPVKVVAQFSKENMMGMLFTIGFITLLMIGGYLRYTWKERVHVPIQLSKTMLGTDSLSQKSLKIVALSDLHLGYTIGKKELEEWVSIINKEHPDIILIAGDIMDNSLRPILDEDLASVFRKLEAPMGVYACLGNHEYIMGLDNRERADFFKKANINLLRDEHIEIDNAFYVVGRDDKSNSKRKELSELLTTLDQSKPIIVLDHQPYDLHVAEENGVDLQISGHTHKGQIWPISMITNLLYEIDHGYLKKGDTHIYVSSGIGLWGGKFRIGTTSEFVVIDVNKK